MKVARSKDDPGKVCHFDINFDTDDSDYYVYISNKFQLIKALCYSKEF